VGRFTEVSAPDRLAFTWAWVDKSGNAPDDQESVVTIEFHRHRDGTDVRLTHERLGSKEARAAHEAGWTASFEKLVGHFA
ncbi:MAG: SRPBCC domain-containing protein, partial [Gammaproteobacteria bacterium]|nr:SRPBCC domain-containing protein [Gammaproteobacteria bacterium]